MTIVAAIFATVFLGPAAMVAIYYSGLMIARLAGARADCPSSDNSRHHFAIIIPAHDEERVLADTLASCQRLDYPSDKLDICVVADNCSDRTATIAREHGVHCLERHDAMNPGKGQALEWAIPQVLASACDAIAIVDADCAIAPHALRVFDHCLTDGSLVLQANHVMPNPDDGPINYAVCIGNVTEYELFYAPKSDLGLAVMLAGTGMVFHRSILEEFPWHAHSLAEDVEYTVTLTKAGIPVRFVSNVGIRPAAAERADQLGPQRRRWAQGALGIGRRQSVSLIASGIRRRNLRLVDLGWTLAVLSRPLVLAHLFVTVILSGLLSLAANGPIFDTLFRIALVVLATQTFYFAVGVAKVGISWHRFKLLVAASTVALRLLGIAIAAAVGPNGVRWERTPR